jgi:hypothetical protein
MYGGTPNGSAGSNTTILQRYDPDRDTWYQSLSPMTLARGWIKGLCSRGKLYALGGFGNNLMMTDRCEAYDIAGDSWYPIAPMPFGNGAYGAVVWRDSLVYVMGGATQFCDSVRSDVIIYDIFRNAWASATSLPIEYNFCDACIIGDTIWFAGGNIPGLGPDIMMRQGAIDPEDPTHIVWSDGPRLPCPDRSTAPTVAMNGKVYFFNRRDEGWQRWWNGWVFDPANYSFTELPLQLVRSGDWVFGCCGVARPQAGELYRLTAGYDEWGTIVGVYCRIGVGTPEMIEEQTIVAEAAELPSATLVRGVLRLDPPRRGKSKNTVLLDASGRTVLKLHSGANDVGSLSPGVYFVSQESPGEGGCTRKVVLTK